MESVTENSEAYLLFSDETLGLGVQGAANLDVLSFNGSNLMRQLVLRLSAASHLCCPVDLTKLYRSHEVLVSHVYYII
jgi:hypothetical protein